jgi:hypothetical protein
LGVVGGGGGGEGWRAGSSLGILSREGGIVPGLLTRDQDHVYPSNTFGTPS